MKLYAANNGLSYKYYQPANGDQATDDDRYDAMKAAAEGGAKVIVAAGFMQATALTKAAAEFTDVKFVFVDRDSAVTLEDGTALKNVLGICFQEEQCGYLAGYAVVKEALHQAGLHRWWRRRQPRLLPLRLRLRAGRFRCCCRDGREASR